MATDSLKGTSIPTLVAVFLAAFLLFLIQPIVAKIILPWFGGGAATWTICLLFFQTLLVIGHLYTDLVSRFVNLKLQVTVHGLLVLTATLFLPIDIDEAWQPRETTQPSVQILLLLCVNVGIPYAVLAATGSLAQVWFAATQPDRLPYKLYALSSFGSLGALCIYPFIIEPTLSNTQQQTLWTVGFLVFAMSTITMAGKVFFTVAPRNLSLEASTPGRIQSTIPWQRLIAWIGLPAIACTMLMAITDHICQDLTVVPFLYVVPLALYLFSIVVCFHFPRAYHRHFFALSTMGITMIVCVLSVGDSLDVVLFHVTSRMGVAEVNFRIGDVFGSSVVIESTGFLILLLFVCMVCHGELFQTKPDGQRVSTFYVVTSLGGALGGLFVAIICPLVFSTFVELRLGLIFSFVIAACLMCVGVRSKWNECSRLIKLTSASSLIGLLAFITWSQIHLCFGDHIRRTRNFYGVVSIHEEESADSLFRIRKLTSRRILQGSQFVNKPKSTIPTGYYDRRSGIGLVIAALPKAHGRRVAVIGLGAGALAAYAEGGDAFHFFELNPAVCEIARNQFSYLNDAVDRNAEIRIFEGDGRLRLKQLPSQSYDVIAIDAFNGGSVPAHLLTCEAFHLYLNQLAPGGTIAMHVSNKHLDLKPVVGAIGSLLDIPVAEIQFSDQGYVGQATSDWLIMTRDNAMMTKIASLASASQFQIVPPRNDNRMPVWTDDYSSLLQVIR